jgi:hypothetical protein
MIIAVQKIIFFRGGECIYIGQVALQHGSSIPRKSMYRDRVPKETKIKIITKILNISEICDFRM